MNKVGLHLMNESLQYVHEVITGATPCPPYPIPMLMSLRRIALYAGNEALAGRLWEQAMTIDTNESDYLAAGTGV